MSTNGAAQRKEILEMVQKYHDAAFPPADFVPGKDMVPVAGRVFDGEDIQSLVEASLDFWLTTGRYAERFENEFASYLGIRHCSLTNSGSSANLLAFMALTSPKLGDRRIVPGDEVITTPLTDVGTVIGVIYQQAVPVFADLDVVVSRGGREERFEFRNPPHVHQPLVQAVVDELLGRGTCESTGRSAARTSHVLERCVEGYYRPRPTLA